MSEQSNDKPDDAPTPRTDAAWREVQELAAYPGDAHPLLKVAGDLERENALCKSTIKQMQDQMAAMARRLGWHA